MITLFENENFIVIDKPAGVLTIPSRRPLASDHDVSSFFPDKRIWIVHRLDREVSGALLLAKSAPAHSVANAWFEKRSIHKFYQALTEGKTPLSFVPGHTETWKSKIMRGKKRAYEVPHEKGKLAWTVATWRGSLKLQDTTVQKWLLEPKTGRSHQLRFHLASHGFSILGDTLYGSQVSYHDQTFGTGIALRAVELNFSECEGAAKLGLPLKIEAKGLY